MQVANDDEKEVFNGDLGLVRAVDTEASELLVDFDGREVPYDFGELDELVLAYATTVHKAQGSEYPAVVLPVTTQHWPMLQRNLLYTGVTRGRRLVVLVVLVAQTKAVAIAVKGQQERQRWSKLQEWLSTEPGHGSHAAAAGGLAFSISDEVRLSQSPRE
jgi:exodeoxyribonuclease V alpha subunit